MDIERKGLSVGGRWASGHYSIGRRDSADLGKLLNKPRRNVSSVSQAGPIDLETSPHRRQRPKTSWQD